MNNIKNNCIKKISRRENDYRGYSSLLRNWEWEWFVSLTFPRGKRFYHEAVVKRDIKMWVRRLQKYERIQIGYYSVICRQYDHVHVHLLMLGFSNKTKKTLTNVSCEIWENEWAEMGGRSKRIAAIVSVNSVRNVANYLARHAFYRKCDQYAFDSYNIKLLHRLRYFG